MIPKIIHYCWFGGKPLPELAIKCIESWKKYCPDFEIIQWDESNFDITCNDYCKEAYEQKKYAFVSDVARLMIVNKFGGVYLDTDVELIKPIDDLLVNKAFFGFEDDEYINTGLGFGSCSDNPVLEALLDDYKNIHYKLEEELFDNIPCTIRNDAVFSRFGLNKFSKTPQEIEGCLFLTKEYLCPINPSTRECNICQKTYSIHRFAGSWLTPEDELTLKIRTGIFSKNSSKFFDYLARLLACLRYRGIKKSLQQTKKWICKLKGD